MKRTNILTTTNSFFLTNASNSTEKTAIVKNTPSDCFRANKAIGEYKINIFTDRPDIMTRVFYSCDFETLCQLRLVSTNLNLLLLSNNLCETNQLSALALKAIIQIQDWEFKPRKLYTHMSSYNYNTDLQFNQNHQEQLNFAKKYTCVSMMPEGNNDIEYIQNPSKFSKELLDRIKNNMLELVISTQDYYYDDHNIDDYDFDSDDYDFNKFLKLLIDDNLSTEQTLILNSIRKLDFSNIPIAPQNFSQFKLLLDIICKPNTPLPKLKKLFLGDISEGINLSFTEAPSFINLSFGVIDGKIMISQLSNLKTIRTQGISPRGSLILENLANFTQISIDWSHDANQQDLDGNGNIDGLLILRNLPKLTLLNVDRWISEHGTLSLENVPNLETLLLGGISGKILSLQHCLKLTTISLKWVDEQSRSSFYSRDERYPLKILEDIPNLKRLTITTPFNDGKYLTIKNLKTLQKLTISKPLHGTCRIHNLENLTTLKIGDLVHTSTLNIKELPKLKTLIIGNIENSQFISNLPAMSELELLSFGNIDTPFKPMFEWVTSQGIKDINFSKTIMFPNLKKISFADVNAVLMLPSNFSEIIEEISFGNINATLTLPNVKYSHGEINASIKYWPSNSPENKIQINSSKD